jgi:diacylglycerol kinase family enzyme
MMYMVTGDSAMYCFIVNPIAGHGKCLKIMTTLTEILLHRNIEYEVVYTDAVGHAETLARQAVGRGCGTVVVVGGDGTVKEAAAGIVAAGGGAA